MLKITTQNELYCTSWNNQDYMEEKNIALSSALRLKMLHRSMEHLVNVYILTDHYLSLFSNLCQILMKKFSISFIFLPDSISVFQIKTISGKEDGFPFI